MGRLKLYYKNMSKSSRSSLPFSFVTSIIAFGVNLFVYINFNRVIKRIDAVYSTNISLNDLSDNLDSIQTNLVGT